MRVPSPPLGTFGRLIGRTECHHAPDQWTPGRLERFRHSRSQCFHQHPFLANPVISSWCTWPTPLGHCLCHPVHSLRSFSFADPVSQAVRCIFFYIFSFFSEEEALHVSQNCHRSNISGQLKETSGMEAYTARPTTGKAALPWQAIRV